MYWFLYDKDLRHERVNQFTHFTSGFRFCTHWKRPLKSTFSLNQTRKQNIAFIIINSKLDRV